MEIMELGRWISYVCEQVVDLFFLRCTYRKSPFNGAQWDRQQQTNKTNRGESYVAFLSEVEKEHL